MTELVKRPRLLRSGMVTAAATFLSRILGMVRDIAIAQLLGAGLMADVFFFANRIPNFFRRLFAEGAFAQAFVPVLTRTSKEQSSAELKELIAKSAGTLGLIVLVISVIGMLASPVVTAIFGWGWFESWLNNGPDAHKFTQASFLLEITFPYLFFITLTALCSSVLNVHGSFAIPAITPCLLNIVMIGTAWFIAPDYEDPNVILSLGMVAGGVVQLVFQLPFIWRLGLMVLPRWGWSHPGVVRIRTLMIPALFGVSASQLNLLVNTVLASFLATGSISYLYYSDRLLEFPIGIFAVAISTVILPALSRCDIKTQHDQYNKTLDWGVRLVLLLGIPSALGIIALREPILRVIFMRGAFTEEHVLLSSSSLLASVSGLCAIMLVRVLVQGFAAIQDTRTPVRCSIVAIAANIVFNLILVWPLDYVGLALSTALAAFVNAGQLLYLLHKRKIYRISRQTLLFIFKALIAGLIMAGSVRYFSPDFTQWAQMTTLVSVGWLIAFIIGGAAVFVISCLIMGIRPRQIRM
ncbi:murein biosynthesis integral membrane protein MurJ [Anaerobiospirillum sp. NML120449]|uniref:murein biosynthesis integral membrane protein MurJ n=1 Tax=Anaerobiospirillum sp. NML120449 TaxID=2932817 RepID=UPI001FF4FFE2|nr:murein biosynthesis integral membrane protein MurJ [Anaerobiospirillum sp. NML120449]MCK0526718.1 murein biosynthesis integral membrane protein MurJ [Anaerobiospirillum sp. NML120449]